MPACLALQASAHPAQGQEVVYPGGARPNRRVGGFGDSLKREPSQSCSMAIGTRPQASSVNLALQALPSMTPGTVLLPGDTCKDPPQSGLPGIVVTQARPVHRVS